MLDSLPGWVGAVGALVVIASALGAAVAVYRTTLQGTSLREAEATIDRLRGDLHDSDRRELKLEADLKIQKVAWESCHARVKVLEDLLTKRKGDDEIRAEIAAVKKAVDENFRTQLAAIMKLLEGGPARD